MKDIYGIDFSERLTWLVKYGEYSDSWFYFKGGKNHFDFQSFFEEVIWLIWFRFWGVFYWNYKVWGYHFQKKNPYDVTFWENLNNRNAIDNY